MYYNFPFVLGNWPVARMVSRPRPRVEPNFNGARRSRRFNVQNENEPGISSTPSCWTLKRAKARAPKAPDR